MTARPPSVQRGTTSRSSGLRAAPTPTTSSVADPTADPRRLSRRSGAVRRLPASHPVLIRRGLQRTDLTSMSYPTPTPSMIRPAVPNRDTVRRSIADRLLESLDQLVTRHRALAPHRPRHQHAPRLHARE